MSDLAIKVEGISKMYRLGAIGSGTITEDLNRAIARFLGKEDPYAKIGQSNNRAVKNNGDFVWSLKDIDFEIKKGEAVGIIGKNGAGKSTLLKILSMVTGPTTGTIKLNGRVASLLEVGTGFHPELSGRDNVFMNGSILGMTRSEIKDRFDEIVDFSGVEKYIDTPVKRYSSGMYVRLAFAIAAHLEPEIMIVDEVLAVGDAEFQKKCLGKMKDVQHSDGRTILFVSHNISAINMLCNKGLLLTNGMLSSFGEIKDVVKNYYSGDNVAFAYSYYAEEKTSIVPRIISAEIIRKTLADFFYANEDISLIIQTSEHNVRNLVTTILVENDRGDIYIHSTDEFDLSDKVGTYRKCRIPGNILPEGNYFITIALGVREGDLYEKKEHLLSFEIRTPMEIASKNIAFKGLLSSSMLRWES